MRSFGDQYSFTHVFVLYLRNFLHQINLCDDFPLFYDLTGHDYHFVMPRLRRGCSFAQADFGKSLICTFFAFFKLFQQLWRPIEPYFLFFVRRCYLFIIVCYFMTDLSLSLPYVLCCPYYWAYIYT